MLRLSSFFAICLVAVPAATIAAFADGWTAWKAELGRQCPSHHVDWIAGGVYPDLLDRFEKTLKPSVRQRVTKIADLQKKCAKELAGFDCEMGGSLRAYQRLGLMASFTAVGCHEYTCTEPSICPAK